MEVAALLLRPKGAEGNIPVVLYVDDDGKEAVRGSALVRRLLAAGMGVFALDPRGTGETAVHDNHLASDTVCLGRHILAQRTWDVMQSVRFLQSSEGGGVAVRFYGRGASGLLGIYAGALNCPLERIVADGALASYRFALEDTQPQPLWVFVPRLLEVADIAHISALAAPVPLSILNPVGYGKIALPDDEARAVFAPTTGAYELLGRAAALGIATGERGDAFEAVTQSVP